MCKDPVPIDELSNVELQNWYLDRTERQPWQLDWHLQAIFVRCLFRGNYLAPTNPLPLLRLGPSPTACRSRPINLRLETNGDRDQGACWLPPRPGSSTVDVVSRAQPQDVSIIAYHWGGSRTATRGRCVAKKKQTHNISRKGRRCLAKISRASEKAASRVMGVYLYCRWNEISARLLEDVRGCKNVVAQHGINQISQCKVSSRDKLTCDAKSEMTDTSREGPRGQGQ